MKITCKIENYDSLPDGGPLEFSANGRGFEAGRGSEMDWTLPDPNRRISSRHFEVAFRDRQFWLNDLSANGTMSMARRCGFRRRICWRITTGSRLVITSSGF